MLRSHALLLGLAIGISIRPALAQNWPQGPGCTTTAVIDWDCDGYGPGSPLGPDADDTDPAVNTPASAIQRYGTTQTLLAHLGYTPRRLLFISVAGNDSTGQPNSEAQPYASWKGVASIVTAGDAVIWRAGTYADAPYLPISGTPANPIILMAYPGEKAILDQQSDGITFVSQSNIVLDGLIIQNTIDGYGNGLFFGDPGVNITIRNMEVWKRYRGILGMNGLSNVLIERSIFHDTTGEHGIYLGARDKPNSDIVVRYNLIYHATYTGFQHNGRVSNLVVDSNIIHTNTLSALSFLEGVSNSVVKNNLLFGNGRNCMLIWDYADPNPAIAPYDQTNDLFVNNTCWVGSTDLTGAAIQQQSAINIDDGGFPVSMNNHRFENNIFVTQNYAVFQFSQPQFLSTASIRNNVMINAGGAPYVLNSGSGYGFAALNSWDTLKGGNVSGDPLFRAAQTGWYSSPENYDFTLRPGSPAHGIAIAADAPGVDLARISRGTVPDAGAIQFSPVSAVQASGLSCTLPALWPGASTSCTVTLNGPASTGGVRVALSADNALLMVPAAVTVPAGSTAANFTASAGAISAAATAVISASAGAGSVTASISLTVSGGSPETLLAFTCAAFNLPPNGSTVCTVTLSQAASAAGATVPLFSSSPALGLPAAVTIPAGSASATFAIVAGASGTGGTAVITASHGGTSLTATISLEGAPPAQNPTRAPAVGPPGAPGIPRNPAGQDRMR